MDSQLAPYDGRTRSERLRGQLDIVLGLPPPERVDALIDLAAGDDAMALPLAVRVRLLGRAADELRRSAAPPRQRARGLSLLAGAEHSLRRRALARLYWLEALLLDPWGSALAGIPDDEVRGLPDVARTEMGLVEDPVAWAAAVGVVIGALPPHPPARLPPTANPCLARARRFVAALPAARAGDVDARREMKQLAPQLFDAYLDGLREGR
jgi:hypothetical protein